MTHFSSDQLVQLEEGYAETNVGYERLVSEYLTQAFTNDAAYEYVRHGFVRRLGTWNVAPTDPLSIVHYDSKDRTRSLDVMRWSLIP